jgi:hypothetical protein
VRDEQESNTRHRQNQLKAESQKMQKEVSKKREQIAILLEMGFEYDACVHAIESMSGSVELATVMLLQEAQKLDEVNDHPTREHWSKTKPAQSDTRAGDIRQTSTIAYHDPAKELQQRLLQMLQEVPNGIKGEDFSGLYATKFKSSLKTSLDGKRLKEFLLDTGEVKLAPRPDSGLPIWHYRAPITKADKGSRTVNNMDVASTTTASVNPAPMMKYYPPPTASTTSSHYSVPAIEYINRSQALQQRLLQMLQEVPKGIKGEDFSGLYATKSKSNLKTALDGKRLKELLLGTGKATFISRPHSGLPIWHYGAPGTKTDKRVRTVSNGSSIARNRIPSSSSEGGGSTSSLSLPPSTADALFDTFSSQQQNFSVGVDVLTNRSTQVPPDRQLSFAGVVASVPPPIVSRHHPQLRVKQSESPAPAAQSKFFAVFGNTKTDNYDDDEKKQIKAEHSRKQEERKAATVSNIENIPPVAARVFMCPWCEDMFLVADDMKAHYKADHNHA